MDVQELLPEYCRKPILASKFEQLCCCDKKFCGISRVTPQVTGYFKNFSSAVLLHALIIFLKDFFSLICFLLPSAGQNLYSMPMDHMPRLLPQLLSHKNFPFSLLLPYK